MNQAKYFDSIANEWNEIRSEYFSEKLRDEDLKIVDVSNKACADLGCGTGFISLGLSQKANIVFSVDISKNMLKELSRTAAKKNIKNIYPIKGTMDDLPLFDRSMDFVFANMSLHHVPDAEKAINEMFRILKKGGTVIISDANKHNAEWAKEEMHDAWLGFSHDQITNWMKNAGFSNIKISETNLKCTAYSSRGEYVETGIFIAKAEKLAERNDA